MSIQAVGPPVRTAASAAERRRLLQEDFKNETAATVFGRRRSTL